MSDDELSTAIGRALWRRAGAVEAHDRLDEIIDGGRPAEVRRRRSARGGRMVFAGAAAVLALAATAAVIQWDPDEVLQTGPSDAPASIYPVLGDLADATDASASDPSAADPADLEPLIQRSLDTPGAVTRLTLGRRNEGVVHDIVLVVVTPAADPTRSTPVSAPPGQQRRIGDRLVDFVPAGPGSQADVVIWMDAAATAAQIADLERLLDASSTVASFVYRDQQATFAEFQTYYAGQPEVLDLVEPEQVPTSFQLQLESTDPSLVNALTQELGGLPGVSAVDGADNFVPFGDRYQWEEAGATVVVTGGTGADSVVGALLLTPGPGLPRISLGDLPDGMGPLDGPAPLWTGPLPALYAGLGDGNSIQVSVTERLTLPLRPEYNIVAVGDSEGFLTVGYDDVSVAWPVPGTDLWVTLDTSGLDPDQTRRLAAGVTFTDRATWEARYIDGFAVDTTVAADGDATASTVTTPSITTALAITTATRPGS